MTTTANNTNAYNPQAQNPQVQNLQTQNPQAHSTNSNSSNAHSTNSHSSNSNNLNAHTSPNITVIKFGGASLSGQEQLEKAARIVSDIIASDFRPCVIVVSGAAGETDRLFRYCFENQITDENEIAKIVSQAEQQSAEKLAGEIRQMNIKAQALNSTQIPLHIDQTGQLEIPNTNTVITLLQQNITPVITGFQGINDQQQLQLLARGGSDITAITLAAALNASCVFYKDVEGVFEKDPKIHSDAKRFKEISYDALIMLAEHGAKIVQVDAAKLGRKHGIRLEILDMESKIGTVVV